MNNVIYQIEKIPDPEKFIEARYLPVLNEQERLRYQVISDPKIKRQFLFSRFILKNKLFEILGRNANEISFSLNDYGKPYLPERDRTFFSLSHSDHYIGYVISKKEVGLDIQVLREFNNLEGLIEKVCHENEARKLSEIDDKEKAFTKLWSLKEAFSKCTGKGIQENFALLDFSELLDIDKFSSHFLTVIDKHFECEFSILERSDPLFVSAFKMR